MQVDIVIVNWNAGAQLLDCVNSILKYGKTTVDKIVVVDNASTDGSEKEIENLQGVTLVRAGANLGFAKACNLGAKYASKEFLLFLNPDSLLYVNTLDNVLTFMQKSKNAHVGICGVQLFDENGSVSRSCARFPTAFNLVVHAFGLDRIFPKIGHFMSEWDHSATRQVDHVIGAFFFVRKSVFDVLNGFDETFFLYLEDLDFSYRTYLNGWASVYITEAQAFHAGGGTSKQIKAKRLFYSLRSRIIYAFKHFNFFAAFLVLGATLFVEPIPRMVLAISRRSMQTLKETAIAYGMLFNWLPAWFFSGITR